MSREVAPELGELCSCGRPAALVYETDDFGRVGDCGVPNALPLNPCRDVDCPLGLGDVGRHDVTWCTPERRALHKQVWRRRLAELTDSVRG